MEHNGLGALEVQAAAGLRVPRGTCTARRCCGWAGEGQLLRANPRAMATCRHAIASIDTSTITAAALCVAFLANLTAFPITNGLLPFVARDIFHTDQTGLGYFSASFAVGSLTGSITLSLVSGVRIARLLIGATLAWYAMLLVFVEIRTMPVAMACLVLAGIAQSMSMISAAVILMRTASAHLRGRVMGVRMMVIYGLPIGLLAAGSLIDLIGYSAMGSVYAVAGIIAMLAIAVRWREDLWPAHAPANAG